MASQSNIESRMSIQILQITYVEYPITAASKQIFYIIMIANDLLPLYQNAPLRLFQTCVPALESVRNLKSVTPFTADRTTTTTTTTVGGERRNALQVWDGS